MKRYFSSFMGMKESEKGEWVEYSLYLSERGLLEEIAKSRLETIHERNEEIITLKQELDTLEQGYVGLRDEISRMEGHIYSLEEILEKKEEHIDLLSNTNDKLTGVSKLSDVKTDLFIFSISLNVLLLLSSIVYFIK
jgi:predicted nuclease with TOPRIM domain